MKVTMDSFHSVWVAMVTPWDPDKGTPKRDVLGKLIDRFIEAGVTGLYILGTTGEGTLLPIDKRKIFAETVMDISASKIPVIVHTGHDQTVVARNLSRHAASIGAAAVAVAPPCRYRLTEEELKEHYLKIATAVGDLPLFLYDIPATTGNPLSASLLTALHADAANVIGAKVSRGDWEAWEGYTSIADKYVLLIGKDEMAFPLLNMGGSGLVASGANVFPELYVALCKAVEDGRIKEGNKLQTLITELCRITHRGNVPAIKRALALMGWDVDPPIPPLRPTPAVENVTLRTQLMSLKERATQWIIGGDNNLSQFVRQFWSQNEKEV